MNVGDVWPIRGRLYKIVGFTDDGEPRLVRVESVARQSGGGFLSPL